MSESTPKKKPGPPRKPAPTHCKLGHELTPENSYVRKSGKYCRICAIKAAKITRLRQQAEHAKLK